MRKNRPVITKTTLNSTKISTRFLLQDDVIHNAYTQRDQRNNRTF